MCTMLGGLTGLPYTSFILSEGGAAGLLATGPNDPAGAETLAEAAATALAAADGFGLAADGFAAASEAAGLALAAVEAGAAELVLAGATAPPQALRAMAARRMNACCSGM